jgi:hypothetical protein
MFHLLFRCILQVCLSGYYIYFTHVLHVFYLDVAYILQWLFKRFHVFLQVFQTYVASVSTVLNVYCKCFIWMFPK